MSKLINRELKCVTEVTPFENDPSNGWVRFEEKSVVVKRINKVKTQLQTDIRSCLWKADVEEMNKLLNGPWKKEIPGRISVLELLFDDIPESMIENANDDRDAFDERYGKKAPIGDTDELIPCTVNGEQIYRFSVYDIDNTIDDILVEHDNGDEIRLSQRAARVVQKTATENRKTLESIASAEEIEMQKLLFEEAKNAQTVDAKFGD